MVLVAPLQRPAIVNKLIVSMTSAPLAKKMIDSNPEMSSGELFLAVSLECRALILAIGCWSADNF